MAEEKKITKSLKPFVSPFTFISPWLEEDWFPSFGAKESGLSVSEDASNIYVEAALPGIKPEDIEITFDKGMVWIKGQRKEEEKDKKRSFYRKATSSFSYHLSLPGNVDEKKEPEASYKDGIMTMTFKKAKEKEPKKIKVKKG
jgi:HSP20 family protein